MMSDRLNDALEVCLTASESGVELESCLTLYPGLADELRPALFAAQDARRLAVVDVPTDVMQRSRARLLAHAAKLRRPRASRAGFRLPRWAFASLLVLAFLLFSTSGLLVTSAQSLPGDALYPVKRTFEAWSLELAPGLQVKSALKASYEKRRLDETRSLLRMGRTERVSFEGVLSKRVPGEWTVDEIPVRVSPQTTIQGDIQVGMGLEIEGEVRPDGWIEADHIRLRTFRLSGLVEGIGLEMWTIAGLEVRRTPLTLIDQGIRPGDPVLALVQVDDAGGLSALAVLRLTESPPTPTDTPYPTSTAEREIEFTGAVESITPTLWRIGGRAVTVDARTEIEGDIAVGDLVQVHATLAPNGELTAREIALADRTGEGADEERERNQKDDEHGDPDHEEYDEHDDEEDHSEEKS